MQWVLLLALLLPAIFAFLRRPAQLSPRRRQTIALFVPVLTLLVFFAVLTTWWTDIPAYLKPVSFLMGHAMAEDNAKWLDFTSVLAVGVPMDQYVPMGGPLQLLLVFVATLMGVVSSVTLGGYNEVMVAANTVVYGQFMMVVIAPLALAPLVEARLRRPVPGTAVSGRVRVPWPLIWMGGSVLVLVNLLLTAYGHLTLQFTILICSLWVTTYLTGVRVPHARLLTSLSAAAAMTVWLPMNAIAGVIVISWALFLGSRVVRNPGDRNGWLGLALVALVAVCIWEPMRSSLSFVLASTPSASGAAGSATGGGVRAGVLAGLTDSTLFSAGGGTEQTTAILGGLAFLGVVGAAVVVTRQGLHRWARYSRFLPIALLAGFALTLNVLDQWATGSAPHYGSLKFTFMVVVVLLASCLPLALLLLEPEASGMTLSRWVGLSAIIFLLVIDSLLVRSVAAARPSQWSPSVPFDNPRSYWWPSEVNGTATQSIASNPVACVYLPQGAEAPSAILESQLSPPERVYSCSRLLAGLSSEDGRAQPIVDWLRREWLTNTRAWTDVHGYLSEMSDEVLDKPVILLDDGSNVIGLETMRALLQRYPASTDG